MYEYRKLSPEQKGELVRQRQQRGFPLHEPPHPIRDQRYFLLTATCYEHAHHMSASTRRQQILDAVFEMFTDAGMVIAGWVVLLNHYHLLVHVIDFDALGDIYRAIHGPTSRQWNVEDNAAGRKVWYRFSDRAIRSQRHYYTTLNYIHANPVKHGLAKSPYDWAESSVHWYLEQYGRDWLRDLWSKYPVREYGRGWDEL